MKTCPGSPRLGRGGASEGRGYAGAFSAGSGAACAIAANGNSKVIDKYAKIRSMEPSRARAVLDRAL
jgi:hypothetical protein